MHQWQIHQFKKGALLQDCVRMRGKIADDLSLLYQTMPIIHCICVELNCKEKIMQYIAKL